MSTNEYLMTPRRTMILTSEIASSDGGNGRLGMDVTADTDWMWDDVYDCSGVA